MKPSILNRIRALFTKQKKWEDIEYFDESWKARVTQMAVHIPPGASVMDLGCGEMYLKYLIKENRYIPVDYIKRSENCIVCDFNKKQFPEINADISFISGCLEYVRDPAWFLGSACKKTKKVILSYCCIEEFPDIVNRKSLGWVNHLSGTAIINIFKKNNFKLIKTEFTPTNNCLFVFDHP